jgi:hypothetical protein
VQVKFPVEIRTNQALAPPGHRTARQYNSLSSPAFVKAQNIPNCLEEKSDDPLDSRHDDPRCARPLRGCDG